MASLILRVAFKLSAKKSTAFFSSLLSGLIIFLLASKYERILRKCDLPDPKNPDTQTPILSVKAGSLGLSKADR